MSKYKTTGKQTLFDAENAAQKLSEIGNPLEKCCGSTTTSATSRQNTR